jgi:hypothetical protein
MPFFPGEVKQAIMSTPAGVRSILDAAVSGLLQVRPSHVLSHIVSSPAAG